MPDLDWLIIGGGIHGTHLSLVLTERCGVPRERLRVLDPHPQPLAMWQRLTANVGMDSLRSPGVHQLDLDPKSLFAFAKTAQGRALPKPAGMYGRPPLGLFQAHNEQIINRHKLDELRTIGRAERLERTATGWRVETVDGALDTRRVLLAISAAEQPDWPQWAAQLCIEHAPIHHIFESGFTASSLAPWQHAVVIGGGITAAQTALQLAERAPGTVTLLHRAPLRSHLFDSDPCWMGPKCLDHYARETSLVRRRAIIRASRHRGSLPDYVTQRLRKAAKSGTLAVQSGHVDRAHALPDGQVLLCLEDGTSLHADQVMLATGFSTRRPGGAWLDRAVTEHALPCAPCGYPIVDQTLCWAPGLYVTGPLAELELGPPARNIVGARHAAARLAASS